MHTHTTRAQPPPPSHPLPPPPQAPQPTPAHLVLWEAVLPLPGALLVLAVVNVHQARTHVEQVAGGDVGAGAVGRRAVHAGAPGLGLVEVCWVHVLQVG